MMASFSESNAGFALCVYEATLILGSKVFYFLNFISKTDDNSAVLASFAARVTWVWPGCVTLRNISVCGKNK